MTDQCELLAVTDTFQISGQGLVLLPDFSVPEEGWKPVSVEATIVTPDGERRVASLRLHVANFNIPDPTVPSERRRRILATFCDLNREDVPVGSRVFVDLDTAAALKGDTG